MSGTAKTIRIEPAADGDAGEILTVQRAAYATEAQLYGDAFLPALTQSLEDLLDELRQPHVKALKAVSGARVVGAVRVRIADGTGHIGRLTVVPDLQGQGIGSRLMVAAEEATRQQVRRFELFTGHRSAANLRLYGRLGYRECRREALSAAVTLVYLDKHVTASAQRPDRKATGTG